MTIQKKAQLFMDYWYNMDMRCQDLVAIMQHIGYNDVVERIKQLSEDKL